MFLQIKHLANFDKKPKRALSQRKAWSLPSLESGQVQKYASFTERSLQK